MHDSIRTAQLLTSLLSENSPELGARLKQRLVRACEREGLPRFDQKASGQKKFSEYLRKVHSNIVHVEQQAGLADVLVHLKKDASPQAIAQGSGQSVDAPGVFTIRSDVWQAFSHPDIERKRFLNRSTGVVYHFNREKPANDKEAAYIREVDSRPADFIEIHPISSEVHVAWMRDYLSNVSLPNNGEAVLDSLLKTPYSSLVNTTFSSALGSLSKDWKVQRTEKIIGIIREWADNNSVSFQSLCSQQQKTKVAPALGVGGVFSHRQQAARLLELISDEDIGRVVIPVLLSSILIRSQP